MLYEVITRRRALSHAGADGGAARLGLAGGGAARHHAALLSDHGHGRRHADRHRITSYNVCYTKLLRYALATVFLVLSGYLFYTNLHFFVLFGAMDLVKGFWLFQFLDLRRLLIVLVPMLTMRLVAEERKLGTLVV